MVDAHVVGAMFAQRPCCWRSISSWGKDRETSSVSPTARGDHQAEVDAINPPDLAAALEFLRHVEPL